MSHNSLKILRSVGSCSQARQILAEQDEQLLLSENNAALSPRVRGLCVLIAVANCSLWSFSVPCIHLPISSHDFSCVISLCCRSCCVNVFREALLLSCTAASVHTFLAHVCDPISNCLLLCLWRSRLGLCRNSQAQGTSTYRIRYCSCIRCFSCMVGVYSSRTFVELTEILGSFQKVALHCVLCLTAACSFHSLLARRNGAVSCQCKGFWTWHAPSLGRQSRCQPWHPRKSLCRMV